MNEIELSRVTKTFPPKGMRGPVIVLDRLSLGVSRGSTVAVVGRSGAGKTTLLNIIARLVLPNSGVVSIAGEDDRDGPGCVRIGYLFQRDALLPWRTALSNALLGLECRGERTERHVARAIEMFEQFGLRGSEHALPQGLSGGQRQRVALIQNILFSPRILLLDEPFGSVDYQTKLLLEDALLAMLRWTGDARPTVVFVTHDIEEAIVMADRILVLDGERGFVFDEQVPIDATEKSAVGTRQTVVLREMFGQIWRALALDGRRETYTSC
jgi:NitT/TauT family transport system ATP-binding protein